MKQNINIRFKKKNIMKKIKIIGALLFTGILLFTSCKRKFDNPAPKTPPANSGNITIDSIFKTYVAHYATLPTPATQLFKFNSDVNLLCTVTADEISGNIYKTAYVEDATGALTVKLLNPGGLFVGDKISINLRGVILNDYGGVIQLDSVDIEKKVVKISSGNVVTPTKMTFNQLNISAPGGIKKYQSRLVLLDSVEFSAGNKNKLFADPVNKFSLDRILQNSVGKNIIVRTSGYANFAGNTIPCGVGSIVAIVGEYNGELQLTIRDYKEVNIANAGCPILIKTFDDGSVTSGGWTNYNVTANVNWKYGSYNGQSYGECSNYSGGSNTACETWLISPAVDIANALNPRFSFQNAYNFTGPAIQVLVSTNYVSGNPTAATWGTLTPALSTGGYNWVNSGNLLLGAYKSTNTRVAIKYTGTGSAGSTWEIDDIAVFAE